MSSRTMLSQGATRPLFLREIKRRLRAPSLLSVSWHLTDTDHRALRADRTSKRCFAAALATILLVPAGGSAQQVTFLWGTAVDGSSSDSGEMHLNNGIVAGQVNAARDGILYQGSTISILSIGSQSVISTSIIGDNNSVDVEADQNASNSGDVSNSGSVTFPTNREDD